MAETTGTSYYERHREAILAKVKARYDAKRDDVRSYKKAWHEKNRERIAAKKRDNYASHREEIRASRRASYASHTEAIKARAKTYREAHPEQAKAAVKRWCEANQDRLKSIKSSYHKSNRDRLNQKSRAYYSNHAERLKPIHALSAKSWRDAHPDRNCEKEAKRRAIKRGATVGRVDYRAVLSASDGKCGICGRPMAGAVHFDHIVPLARGGSHEQSNIQASHPRCNLSKGTKLPREMSAWR